MSWLEQEGRIRMIASFVLSAVVGFTPISEALSQATVVQRLPVHSELGKGELVATHTTSQEVVYRVPPTDEGDFSDELIVDKAEIHLSVDGRTPIPVWNRTQRISKSLPYGAISNRLILYDLYFEEDEIWVLYSVCVAQMVSGQVKLDRIVLDEDSEYIIESTIPITDLSESSITPRLMSAGLLFMHDDTLHIGLRLLDSVSRAHRRSHPYEFWVLSNGAVIEIDDPDKIDVMIEQHGQMLDHIQSRVDKQAKVPDTDNDAIQSRSPEN